MKKFANVLLLITLSAIACPKPASAHFRLLKPTSWLKEDAAGGPQKGGPCGPGGYDNVNPTPTSGAVTEFHAGDTIEVDWIDTIAHPGYFRIALAENRADFKNPTIVQDANCNFDESMVPKTASGNVLADGVHFRPVAMAASLMAGTMFSQMVTLPNQPCDKCTLQVMQIMESDIKALSQCYYFHCADIRILPAGQGGSAGGAAGAGNGGQLNGTAGMTAVSMASGGMTILPSGGGTLGVGGLLGGGGALLGGGMGAGVGVLGSGGTTGSMATPPVGSAGTMTSGGAAGASAGAEFGGAAGATSSAAPPSSEGTSCVVASGPRTASSAAASGVALLALLAVARRRQSARGRRE